MRDQGRSRDRWSIVGLGALAVATAGVVVLALLKYQPVAPSTPVTTSPASASPTQVQTATPQSATPSSPSTPLADVARIVNSTEGASVLVLGDGSGDEDDEWVSVWARDHLASRATVSFRTWDRANRQYAAAVRQGSSGPTIEIWNASVRSPDMATEAARVGQVWQNADVVILSYGHRRTAGEISAQMDAVLAAVRSKSATVPVAVMIQNPDRAETEAVQRQTTEAIARWAVQRGLATVDVYGAFAADPTPRNDMVEADGSPTPLGSKLWAKAVADALAGS